MIDWDFDIGYNADSNEVYVNIANIIVSDYTEGYIYIFPCDDNYEHHGKAIQYKYHNSIKTKV